MIIDLHTHTNASDGSFSPSSLIAMAAKHGITTLAITDHDTIGGLKEAAKAALEHGISLIPGIELEIAWNREGEFHLLGLGIERPTQEFYAAIEELARRRQERNLAIVDRMNMAGIIASYDEITAFSTGQEQGGHSIGRPHFASFLVKRKIVKNLEQAFIRYLGRDKPFYIPKAGLDLENAVKLIHESGGIAVLAHPMSLYTAWGRLPELIKSFKEKGLDGLEAWHPATKVSSCKRLEELGKNLGLLVTAGSDYHGEVRPDRKLGITAGGKKINESFLDNETLSKLQCLKKASFWALHDSNM